MRARATLLIATCAFLAVQASAPVEHHGRSAPIAILDDGSRVVVANPDSSSISLIDVATRTKSAEVRIRATPQTLAVSGGRAYVATREGRIVTVDLAAQQIVSASRVGVELFGIVEAGSRLYVSDYGAAAVRVIDAETLAPIAAIPTNEYPRGLALEDATLYVTHLRTGKISVIDTETFTVTRTITTEGDGNLSQAIVISGGRAYVPQTRSNASNPALLFDTTVFPVVSVVDLATGAAIPSARFSIDSVDRPVNMPADAAITTSGKLYVVHAGSDDVSVIDLATRAKIAHIAAGANPRGIVLSPDERLAFVTNALAGTVSVIDTATDAVTHTIGVTTLPLAPNVLNGKILFHNSMRASLSRDRWMSCATCHFEGGVDGRTWFFRDGPRNTTHLFDVEATLPMHWSGDLDELQDVESTVRNVQFGTGLAHDGDNCTPACDTAPPNARRSQDLDDLAAFMRSLTFPRREPAETDSGRRGEALFASNGCLSCHPAPLYTDRRKHDVGTGGGPLERKGSSFDTPSLRGVFDTAPYFHDGSAATLYDVLARHGNAPTLSAAEREDLAAFLKSIPFPEARRRAMRSR